MNRIIVFFIFFISFNSSAQSKNDSIKKLDYIFETGFGLNLAPQKTIGDSVSYLNYNNRKKFGLGVFYNLTHEWKIYSTIEYYQIKIQQLLTQTGLDLYGKKTFSEYYGGGFRYKLNTLKLTGILYHCLIHDDKSTWYIGIGFGIDQYINKSVKSNSLKKYVDGVNTETYIEAFPNQLLFENIDLSMLYEFKLNRIDVGLKFDFTAYGNKNMNYTYNIGSNIFEHNDIINPNNFNFETSLFLKF